MPVKNEQFACKLCNQIIGPWSRGITLHAKSHNMSLQQFWSLTYAKSSALCQCKQGCKELTTFRSWHDGFDEYAIGHYSKKKRSSNTRHVMSLKHWSRGKTKKSDKRLFDAGKKTSDTLRKKHSLREIFIWSDGKTKHDNDSLMAKSLSMSGSKFHFYDYETVIRELTKRLSDRFSLMTSMSDIEKRKNNREKLIELRCNACNSTTKISIYNVMRKSKQRCQHCDVPKKWVSAGELELVDTLKRMFNNVKHTVFVNGWSIDVFVHDNATYFQFDGVYWHGLDRPENEIVDDKILKKVARDKQQNLWFKDNSMNLVRITEIQWSQAKDKVLLINQLLGMQ